MFPSTLLPREQLEYTLSFLEEETLQEIPGKGAPTLWAPTLFPDFVLCFTFRICLDLHPANPPHPPTER